MLLALAQRPRLQRRKFGKIDILVANAGISGPNLKNLGISGRCLEADYRSGFDRSIFMLPGGGAFMLRQKYGRIVNVASIAGKEGNPNASGYSAAKAGVIAFTKSLGKELADQNIAVNVLRRRRRDANLRPGVAGARELHVVQNSPRTFSRSHGDRCHGGVDGLRRKFFHYGSGI